MDPSYQVLDLLIDIDLFRSGTVRRRGSNLGLLSP
jgi:hypothetical protein